MIEFCGVEFGYDRASVLRDLSIALPDGGVTAILGSNGCGKSTLIRLAAGLLRPRRGEVRLDGKALTAYPSKALAQRVAYLPQSRPTPAITVERLVLHGRFPYLGYPRRYRAQDREAAYRAMEAADVLDLRNRELTSLSGGERQKAYIAMALAQDTPCVLMDEPTTYLDIDRQLEVMGLCTDMARRGKTVILVLHDLSLAFRFADRLLMMRDGAPIYMGSPDDARASDALHEVFHVRAHRVPLPDGSAQYLFY